MSSLDNLNQPPLRDLGEDKMQLLGHFGNFYAQQGNLQAFRLDARSRDLWMQYPFPGNVRELRNIVIRLTTKFAGQIVNSEQLMAELDWEDEDARSAQTVTPVGDFRGQMEAARKRLQMQKHFNLDETLRELEKSYVEAALDITHGNLSQAAKLLGIHRTTLYSRMQNYADSNSGGT